jgi:protoporphyrinogen oxidase
MPGTSMTKPHVVILGAGPAGVGAGFLLARGGVAQVTILERSDRVGGNAGSFDLGGFRVDYGSHRLHPACAPEILDDLRALLGNDLLDRPRHGRIRICGRWIHFPLNPVDLALGLPLTFSAGVAKDMVRRVVSGRNGTGADESFASVLTRGLGDTICRDFYFPYARKIWGLEPEQLSATQAHRRVSADSFGKMMRKIASAMPGRAHNGKSHFFYPRQGYGQICDAYSRAARGAGARIHVNAGVRAIDTSPVGVSVVHYDTGDGSQSVRADHVWSTIPITALARCLNPAPPADCLQAAECIDFRAMVLIYLVLEQDRFTEYDAHYFPEAHIPITRLSEPKHYSNGEGPANRTVLCAELPCSPDDPEWNMTDEDLGLLVCRSLDAAGIPVRVPVAQVMTRRLRHAYPVYRQGYETHFNRLDRWLSGAGNLLTFGRQGLFAHDNTHHALAMAYAAVKCFGGGSFDQSRWAAFRQDFQTHRVED